MTETILISPVVKDHGLGGRYLECRDFLMRPLLNGATLGGQAEETVPQGRSSDIPRFASSPIASRTKTVVETLVTANGRALGSRAADG